MNRYKLCILAVVLGLIFCTPVTKASDETITQKDEWSEIHDFLKKLFHSRDQLFMDANTDRLRKFYMRDASRSKAAMRHEVERAEYVRTWAEKRGIRLTGAESEVRVIRVKMEGDLAKVSMVQSLKLSYVYEKYHGSPIPAESFGIGTRHAIVLKKTDGQWFVEREWYLDPLEENPKLIGEATEGFAPSVQQKPKLADGPKYKRKQAVAYANKYAGIAWGAGNKHRYNPKYLDYSGKGGDCTNFASQVIGDPSEGGGLRMSGAWRYFYQVGGSQAWVQTDAFKDFLVYSGYGKIISKGTFADIMKPTRSYPFGAFSELLPGDLIAYILRGNDVDHFSIVVGFDVNGFPMVNSHSADRYRVPFDLGWDKHTKYILIHIND